MGELLSRTMCIYVVAARKVHPVVVEYFLCGCLSAEDTFSLQLLKAGHYLQVKSFNKKPPNRPVILSRNKSNLTGVQFLPGTENEMLCTLKKWALLMVWTDTKRLKPKSWDTEKSRMSIGLNNLAENYCFETGSKSHLHSSSQCTYHWTHIPPPHTHAEGQSWLKGSSLIDICQQQFPHTGTL